MIKCFEFDKLSDGVLRYIKTEQYYTKASLRLYVGMDFGDKVGELKVGPSYVIAEVTDDYTSLVSLQDTFSEKAGKLLANEEFRKSKLGKEIADTVHKAESGVRLIAPVAVTFKMSELPTDFSGNLHKFKDKQYMCKVMSDDYIGFERTPESIEPGIYYICLVLLQDYQGKLNYDYFVKNLQYDKLTAYYLEE